MGNPRLKIGTSSVDIASAITSISTAINDQEKNVHLSDAQTITGAKTFSSPIKTEEIDNTSGNAMLRNKSTEGAIVLGSSAKKAVIMGSGDRPTYSKDGSDFTGSELALKSDIGDVPMATFMANLGIGRWRNQKFSAWTTGNIIYDSLLSQYTDCSYCFAGVQYYGPNEDWSAAPTTAKDVSMTNGQYVNTNSCNGIFKYFDNGGGALTVDIRCTGNIEQGFYSSTIKSITFRNPSLFAPVAISQGFAYCYNLVEVGEFSAANFKYIGNLFLDCKKLKSIHITNWKISFNISFSTAFEEADLVEILNNLDPVSTTQTLTMGATNLAKLTSDDILIATGKGWALA